MRPESYRLWDGVNARNRKMISAMACMHAVSLFIQTFAYAQLTTGMCVHDPRVCVVLACRHMCILGAGRRLTRRRSCAVHTYFCSGKTTPAACC